MKNSYKIQLALTPMLICILSLMLVVVSFSWYQVQQSSNIQVQESSVSISVEAPDDITVKDLALIGDEYSLTGSTYTVTKKLKEDGKTVSLTGYYGQTGTKSHPDVDKPYIVFCSATITSSVVSNDIKYSAYVSKSVVSNIGKSKTSETKDFASSATSGYSIIFFDGSISDNTYTFTDESISVNQSVSPKTIYFGIKFFPSSKEGTKNDKGEFLYSNISYYGCNFKLTLQFVIN